MSRAFGIVLIGVVLVSELRAADTTPPFYSDKANLLVYLDGKGSKHPVKTKEDWSLRRTHILADMQLVMGRLPETSKKSPLEVAVVEEVALPKYVRKRILYTPEPNDRVPAFLFIPKSASRKAKLPAMLCLHQTTSIGKGEPAGIGGLPNLHYAVELAERGYVTLAPDYPNFGDYTFNPYEHGYASATMKGIWNHIRAVDLLQSLPEVDGWRIGCIGHSLGGHNTMFVAAFDPRLKVMVSSCGFNSFFKYYGGDLTGWSHKGYMPRIAELFEKSPARMPFDFTEVTAALAPRPFFINAPLHDDNFEVSGVEDCVNAATPLYQLYRAADRLVAVHPDCAHDFPPAIREQAYQFLDRYLKKPT